MTPTPTKSSAVPAPGATSPPSKSPTGQATPSKESTPSKKKLHQFFKPRGTPTKKSTPTSSLSATATAALTSEHSQEVLDRIARNREAARAKLLAKAATRPNATFDGGLDPSWKKALQKTLKEPFIADLHAFVCAQRANATVYPSPENVFSAFNAARFARVRVVIIGQDPYHGPGQAHGMSFSVPAGVTHPPSLRNIFKELADDIDGFTVPKSGCLQKWADQGVLMLNAVLTVRRHEAASHQGRGWERFTDAVVAALNTRPGPGLVFMLWGGYAKKKGARIDTKRHCVLTSAHPSPLSAHRGWFGSGQFSRANAFLKKSRQDTIDWTLSE